MSKSNILSAAAALVLLSSGAAFADVGHGKSPSGEPGKAADVSNTIEVVMYDNYYEPEEISVKEGETVRFVIKNAGTIVHEFNIGTAKMLMDHAPEMEKMVEHGILEVDRINLEVAKQMQASMGHGMHDMPNAALLEPGKAGEVIWKFSGDGEIEFGCTVPGHYESGMVGEFSKHH